MIYKNNDARFFDTYGRGNSNHHYKVKGFVLRLKILDIVASGGSIGTPTTLLRRILNMKYRVSRQLLWYYLSSLERDGLIFIDRRGGRMGYLAFITEEGLARLSRCKELLRSRGEGWCQKICDEVGSWFVGGRGSRVSLGATVGTGASRRSTTVGASSRTVRNTGSATTIDGTTGVGTYRRTAVRVGAPKRGVGRWLCGLLNGGGVGVRRGVPSIPPSSPCGVRGVVVFAPDGYEVSATVVFKRGVGSTPLGGFKRVMSYRRRRGVYAVDVCDSKATRSWVDFEFSVFFSWVRRVFQDLYLKFTVLKSLGRMYGVDYFSAVRYYWECAPTFPISITFDITPYKRGRRRRRRFFTRRDRRVLEDVLTQLKRVLELGREGAECLEGVDDELVLSVLRGSLRERLKFISSRVSRAVQLIEGVVNSG